MFGLRSVSRWVKGIHLQSTRAYSNAPKAITINLHPPKDSHSLPPEHQLYPTCTSDPPFDRHRPTGERNTVFPRAPTASEAPAGKKALGPDFVASELGSPAERKRKLDSYYEGQLIHSKVVEDEVVQPIKRINEATENMRARLLYQSRKRGILETDLLLSTFASKFLKGFSRDELQEYDRILDCPDWNIYYWATGKKELADDLKGSKIMEKLIVHVRNEARETRRMPDVN
ncbi:Succinate dehydrogenase assembly factor 2, mitochondrial [Neolecta irregularis DAH-3]|uniref:Succinate dehydrogenase assembly factor 2, mitochondrial n=1 Tax=Neolecta irregularis (strain DAH-3) TaxID=1198029 RepID=A0A1U7LNP3_NEOID|nr:Succinate dehydrogenase assembly factor 2, mitochondrial [Neolecta irregularis DAH-3]|eukprot:OLL24248.1 Succinate dehydrogenase assembly factor 2, mitochondrial [Neolecta irregularis DAH-3]